MHAFAHLSAYLVPGIVLGTGGRTVFETVSALKELTFYEGRTEEINKSDI